MESGVPMFHELGSVTLKTGETVEIGCVQGPELAWAERVEKLLGHKNESWRAQNSHLLRNDAGVEAYFYILHRAGLPFANIMTVELNGVGILGHVWTNPDDRRKGAIALLMERQMDHFRARGGRALYLGTGFNGPPYRIYESFGFRGIEDRSGVMEYYATSKMEFEAWYFKREEADIQPLNWRHWPASPALFAGDFPGVVRCAPLKMIGRYSTEGYLLDLLRAQSREEPPRAMALTRPETGAVAGMAVWDLDPLWGDACSVDVYCHPNYWGQANDLLDALCLAPGSRYIAYTDATCPEKRDALIRAGFHVMATLPGWVPRDAANSGRVDVTVMERV